MFGEGYKWRHHPGFCDPCEVVSVCVALLAREVHPRVEWARFDVEGARGRPGGPCEGIKIYLSPLPEDPEITREVRYYIHHPCKSELERVICKSSKRALLFMLEYLKLRGAFIDWNVNDYIGSLNSICKKRCMIRYATSYLERLPELDYCACVCLGKYLHYVLSVSYAHEMFFMKDILAKLYGGIFIRLVISKEMQYKFTEESAVEYSVSIFENMLLSCPWYQYSPTESVRRTIYPNKVQEFTHKYTELGDYIQKTSSLPVEYECNLGEIIYQNRLKNPNESITNHISKAEDICPRLTYKGIGFPPDKCNLNFGIAHNDPSKA